MADTKISALNAASVAAVANEFAINEAGTSKKLTLQQIADFLVKRAANMTVAAGDYTTQLVLAANSADITGITFATVMTITDVGVGRYHFKCQLVYQTTAITTGINVAVNHTGTLTQFYVEARVPTTGAAAATKAAVNAAVASLGGLYEAEASIVKGGAIGTISNFTISVIAANSDHVVTLEGFMVVSVSGNLQIQLSAELAALVCRAMQGSFLELKKLS